MSNNLCKWCSALPGLLLLVMGWGYLSGAQRSVIVHVSVPPLAWSGSALEAKLKRQLSRDGDLIIVTVPDTSPGRPEFPHDAYNTDNLTNWGMEVGGRYLLTVEVHSERLEKRKLYHFPLVFHKYVTVGVIEGELRLIDITRGKLLSAEPFKVEQKGPQVFQATMDDNINDPDLHLTAPGKTKFFDRLEEKLASHVAGWVRKVMRLR